jgi:hypothetical protein
MWTAAETAQRAFGDPMHCRVATTTWPSRRPDSAGASHRRRRDAGVARARAAPSAPRGMRLLEVSGIGAQPPVRGAAGHPEPARDVISCARLTRSRCVGTRRWTSTEYKGVRLCRVHDPRHDRENRHRGE